MQVSANILWRHGGKSANSVDMDPVEITTQQQVIFCDTDCGGVVSNIAYLRFVEAARVKLGEALGWGLKFQAERGEFITVVRTEIDYRRPARLGDQLVIHGRLDQVERARFWNDFRIEREGELLVACRQRLAIVKLPEGRPMRIPEEWQRSEN